MWSHKFQTARMSIVFHDTCVLIRLTNPYFFTSEFQWRSFNNCFSRTPGKITRILINSNVVQTFYCRLALFHAAPAAGSQLDGFPFWSVHPLSCLSINRDLRNDGTKAWTHPTQKWNWFRCPVWSMTWQNKTQTCSPPLSYPSGWVSWMWEPGVVSASASEAMQVKKISAGELLVRQSHHHPSSCPSGAGFAPHQLNSRPKAGMPLRGRSVPSVLL